MGTCRFSIRCEIKENENKMRKDMMDDAKEMLEAAGVKNVSNMITDTQWEWAFMKWEQHVWAEILKHLY